ncbi:MAG: RHS repeat-associated core domain-containing protein, partial [Caldilineaceae bacterium]|nr:RHS repeat-associated core domain-containing protein [Caldilineaceae bacterium]
SAYNTFTYDAQNRVSAAYGQSYGYDTAGRLTSYEGAAQTVNNSFPGHAIKKSGYCYDANGNAKSRPGQTLLWDVQNRLKEVTNGTTTIESYLYDPDGQRVKKVAGSTSTYYISPLYEISGGTIIKYYYFNGQRIAQKNGSTLYYLHSDQLGSTVLTTSSANATQTYYAYGRLRNYSGSFPTRHQFTGQYIDDTGLYYYGARYYDREIGAFISPDTLVPDATNLFDYNRYMYVRGRVLNMNDPTGHYSNCTMDAGGSMACADNEVTGGVTLSIDPANEPQSSNPNGTQQFLTTMATVGVASFGAGFITPYLASLWPAAVEGGTVTATAACADGDCTNEV